MSNGYGSYWTTREADMAAHDACPPLLRHAMNYAVSPMASVPLLNAWRTGIPERELIGYIQSCDRRNTRKTYGPTHPEAARD